MKSVGSRGLIFFVLGLYIPGLSFSDDSLMDSQTHEDLSYWNQVNLAHSPGSLGSIGQYVSIGIQQFSAVPDDHHHFNKMVKRMTDDSETPSHYATRVTISTGTSFPVDLFMSAASFGGSDVIQGSVLLQYTLYEELKRPTLSFRLGQSKLFQLDDAANDTSSFDALTSYGFLRYFVLYAGLGVRNNMSRFGEENPANFKTQGLVRTLGAQINLSPTFDIGCESQRDEMSQKSSATLRSRFLF